MEQVKWKVEGIFRADAAKCAAEIGDGKTSPQEILEKARDIDSELHKCFEWDDSVAAEKYRLKQAGDIIRMLVFVPKTEEEPEVRCFQITTEKSVYQPTKLFVKQEDEYNALLKRALAELESFKQRYKTLSELEAVFEEIEKVL